MKYRPEIDGLRAVAVTSVILSHAGVSLFAGGFIGVDIFFVISGYLITNIIQAEIAAGRFSILAFYERRARRILPALLVLLVFTTAFAWYWMLPDFRENYGQSVVATLLFANNILLAKTSGYWDLESAFKPLLHTWSLGVEEQFYIVFPIFLYFMRNTSKPTLITVLALLSVTSLVAAQVGAAYFPAANFYLPLGRAWELLAGCICALTNVAQRRSAGLLSLVGLALITASVLGLHDATPSPSIMILPAVVGAALIILFAHENTLVAKLLSIKPVVFIGLISYSAYLWHQPLFAFARIYNWDRPTVGFMLLLALAALLLAWLSWRFVEQPFRKPTVVSRPQLLFSVGIVSSVFLSVGIYLHITHGRPDTVFPSASSEDLYIAYNERIRDYTRDSFPVSSGPKILVFGNSFSRDVANALIESGWMKGKNFVYRSDNFCGDAGKDTKTIENLLQDASLIIMAGQKPDCAARLHDAYSSPTRRVVMIGPKDFGYNMNPIVRVAAVERAKIRMNVAAETLLDNEQMKSEIPARDYIDLVALLGGDGRTLPAFDNDGNILSQDRKHFTKFGAVFAGPLLVNAPQFSSLSVNN